MTNSSKRSIYLSNKSIFKSVIRSLLLRQGPLTAKQIQEKAGLKKQTTYNYLKELVEEGRIQAKERKVKNKPNLRVTDYSRVSRPIKTPSDMTLSETVKLSSEKKDAETFGEEIRQLIEDGVTALIEIRTLLHRLTDEEIESYVKCDPDVWGLYSMTFLLSDEEYNDWFIEFKQLVDKLHEKWSTKKQEQNQHASEMHVVSLTLFKAYK